MASKLLDFMETRVLTNYHKSIYQLDEVATPIVMCKLIANALSHSYPKGYSVIDLCAGTGGIGSVD